MQLTRAEIAETQIIVTTPEKWDVVTRKPTGEGELASVGYCGNLAQSMVVDPGARSQKVKLLIIDEVHLLNEDRGAVIESIVARTLRQARALFGSLAAPAMTFSDIGRIHSVPHSRRQPEYVETD
jgi:antiviral helicase SLH1